MDTFYDVIINCESVLNLTAGEGWKIQLTNSDYHLNKVKDTVVVSFYGLYNKGRLFSSPLALLRKILPGLLAQ